MGPLHVNPVQTEADRARDVGRLFLGARVLDQLSHLNSEELSFALLIQTSILVDLPHVDCRFERVTPIWIEIEVADDGVARHRISACVNLVEALRVVEDK